MRKKPQKPSGLRFTYPHRFEQLWAAYPKTKSGSKWTAFEAWWQLDLTEDEALELIAHVERRCKDDAKWLEGKYVPMLSTFLNQRRWDDDYAKVQHRAKSRIEQANEEFEARYANAERGTLTAEQVRDLLNETGVRH